MKQRTYTDEEFIEAVKTSFSKGSVLKKLGLAVCGGNYYTFKNNIDFAEGWWVGNQLVVETLNDKASEKQFTGEGSFIGWSSVSLQRDRGITNNSEPSEKFVFRPDLMVNAPSPMTSAYYIWKQENP